MKLISFFKENQFFYFALDLLMMFILLVNLSWIIFDWLFSIEAVKLFMAEHIRSAYQFYLPVHRNFFYYDLIFVGIFVIEIVIRWVIAIKRRLYHRWFFYPFIHWYDVLGCIPIGSLRFLRLLRIISIFFRLQRLRIVDFTRFYPFQVLYKYYDVLTEELTDRVMLKMISGVQEELKHGNPVVSRINSDILRPRKEVLVDWLSERLQRAVQENYSQYRSDIRDYINQGVQRAVHKNQKMATIGSIPVLGRKVTRDIEKMVSDLVYHVLNDFMQDVAANRMHQVIDEVTEVFFGAFLLDEKRDELDRLVTEVLQQTLEIVKDQVRVQQWKLREQFMHNE